jgi:protein-disulfide isomerase
MTEQPQPTKKERREAARAERIAAEERAAAAAARKRRLGILGGLLVAAVAVVVLAIALSGGDDNKAEGGGGVEGAAKVNKLYAGIPQDGITLGDPKAKATIVVFADPQCPFCRDFDQTELPEVVEKQVRTGRAKLVLRMRAFLGEDSLKATNALYAASEQDKMFQAAAVLYDNQGEENSGWVTEEKLREILGAVQGLDVDKALTAAEGETPARLLGEAESLASRYGSQSTPDIYVGTSENDANKTDPTAAAINKAVDEIAG